MHNHISQSISSQAPALFSDDQSEDSELKNDNIFITIAVPERRRSGRAYIGDSWVSHQQRVFVSSPSRGAVASASKLLVAYAVDRTSHIME